MEDPLGDEHQSVLFLFLFYFSLLLLSNSFLYRDPHLPAYSFGCARLATSESSWHFGVEPQGILVSLLLLPFTSLLVNVQEGRRRGSLKDKRLDLSLSLFLSFFLFLFIDREDFLSRCRVVHLCIAIILPNCLEIGLRFFTYLLTYTVLSSRVAARKRKTEPSQDSKGNSAEGYRASCSYWSQVRFYYVAILSILVSCWGV